MKRLLIIVLLLITNNLYAETYSYTKDVNVSKLAMEILSGIDKQLMMVNSYDNVDGYISYSNGIVDLIFDEALSPSDKTELDSIVENHIPSELVLHSTETVEYNNVFTFEYSTSGKSIVNQNYLWNNTPKFFIMLATFPVTVTTSTEYEELIKTPAFPAPFLGFGEAYAVIVASTSLDDTTVNYRVECSTDDFYTQLVDCESEMYYQKAGIMQSAYLQGSRNISDYMVSNPVSVRILWKVDKGSIYTSEVIGNRIIKRIAYPNERLYYDH